MKIIFLDVDGVLNCGTTKERHKGMLGIEDEKVTLLREIIEATGAKVVLTSTWRIDWERDVPFESLNSDGRYLVKKLADQDIEIIAKVPDVAWSKRGAEILEYIHNSHEKIDGIVILDDERFDFEETGLVQYLVKTQFLPKYPEQPLGLQKSHVLDAIKILKGIEFYDN